MVILIPGNDDNLAQLLIYNSFNSEHAPISSGNDFILFDDNDSLSIFCIFPISDGTIVSLFLYNCNSVIFVNAVNISGCISLILLLPILVSLLVLVFYISNKNSFDIDT